MSSNPYTKIMAKNRLPEELKKFGNIFDSLSRRHGTYYIFQDFLDLSINAWSFDYKMDLMAIRKKYSEKERQLFGQLIHETIHILDRMIVSDNDFYDVFGTFYEANSLTNKHFAQFFTPLHVCQLMAQLTLDNEAQNFNDPCSGSARFSLASNSVKPGMFHSLIDIDFTCARMSALNLMYHGIHGIIICDNGLIAGKSFRGAFIVNRWLTLQGVPQIEFVDNVNHAYDYIRVKLGLPKPKKVPAQSLGKTKSPIQEVADVIVDSKTNQISLF